VISVRLGYDDFVFGWLQIFYGVELVVFRSLLGVLFLVAIARSLLARWGWDEAVAQTYDLFQFVAGDGKCVGLTCSIPIFFMRPCEQGNAFARSFSRSKPSANQVNLEMGL
jgi:hypothetical protein